MLQALLELVTRYSDKYVFIKIIMPTLMDNTSLQLPITWKVFQQSLDKRSIKQKV